MQLVHGKPIRDDIARLLESGSDSDESEDTIDRFISAGPIFKNYQSSVKPKPPARKKPRTGKPPKPSAKASRAFKPAPSIKSNQKKPPPPLTKEEAKRMFGELSPGNSLSESTSSVSSEEYYAPSSAAGLRARASSPGEPHRRARPRRGASERRNSRRKSGEKNA